MLRNQNEIMRARLEMFDSMMVLFNSNPNFPSRGMSEDIAWSIDKFIEKQKPSGVQETEQAK